MTSSGQAPQSPWRVLVDPPGEPQFNMDRDEALSRQSAEESRPMLRIYRWDRPAVSLGRRQSSAALSQEILHSGIPIVRRPTGGGAVLHRLDEWTYALAVPRGFVPGGTGLREIPALLHERLREELVGRGGQEEMDLRVAETDAGGPYTFCFSAPVRGDLIYRSKKVGGMALRVWRDGVLIQGTLQGLPFSGDSTRDAIVQAACGLTEDSLTASLRG